MTADGGFPSAFNSVVHQGSSFQPTDSGVVYVTSCFPPPASGEAGVGSSVSQPGVKKGVVRIRPLVAAPDMQETDMSVSTDARLIQGRDGTVSTKNLSYTPIHAAAAQKLTDSRVGRTFRLGT